MIRTLVNRWFLGAPPGGVASKDFRSWVVSRLKDLERVLQILHPAVEYPDSETSHIITTANTNITAVTPTTITALTLSFTPTVNTQLVIHGVFVVTCTALSAVGDTFSGTVEVNSVAQSPVLWGPSAAGTHTTATGVWVVPLSSMTTYTVSMTGTTSNTLTTFRSIKDASSLTLLTVPNPYVVPS